MMSSLLAYSDLVPPSARDAIRAAHAARGSAVSDRELRRAAARELYQSGKVDCRDALELVDLGDESPDCGCT